MPRHIPTFVASALIATLAWTTAAGAAPGEKLNFAAPSAVWLTGDSTLHPYKSTASQLQASVAVTPGANGAVKFADLEVVIPVKGLKSGQGALDDNMVKALSGDKFPTIRFASPGGEFRVAGSGAVTIEAAGTLTVAGVSKPTTITASGTASGGVLKLKGSQALKMSTFGVKPPVLMGGMIKTEDQVVVHFDMTTPWKR